MTLLITPATNHLHALSHVAVASAVTIGSPGSPTGYIHVGIRCKGLFLGIFPKGEKCCQFLAACYVYIVLIEAIYNS
jgi:hypothetical protein